MKKQIIIAALALGAFVFGTNNAQAQDDVTATTTVNIILGDVISIDEGSVANGGIVDFNYVTAANYNDGLPAVTVPSSLIVTSTKDFDINVKAGGGNFNSGETEDVIPVNVLTIKAATGGTMAGTQPLIVLSTTDQTLVQDAPLGSALTLDLDYEIPAAKSSGPDILGKTSGTYTQTVTYTATVL